MKFEEQPTNTLNVMKEPLLPLKIGNQGVLGGGVPQPSGWLARLELVFGIQNLPPSGVASNVPSEVKRLPVTRSVLAKRRHLGPLMVQRPFYPEGPGVCHLYVLHPPGGVVGGDRLEIDVVLEPGAKGLITTPAAGKFYRNKEPGNTGTTNTEINAARQHQALRVSEGAVLEWLPQETIFFEGAQVELSTRVDLAPGARFALWDILCLGRPASGEGFEKGTVVQRLEIWEDDKPLLVERVTLEGGGDLLKAPWGWSGYPVGGTLVALPENVAEAAQAARQAVGEANEGESFGITTLNGLLIARYLGRHGERAKEKLGQVWAAIRPGLNGQVACPPRIWNT